MTQKTFAKIIYNQSQPQRLDKFLSEKFPEFSRRFFQKNIKNRLILVNQKPRTPKFQLKFRDVIEIKLKLQKPSRPTSLPANPAVKIKVVAKYPDFFIIYKPAGLCVHPSLFDVENNSLPPTLAGGLLNFSPDLKNVGEDFIRPAIVHRLDKDTSGLMIIPRHQEAFRKFKKMFQQHKIEKTYWALSYNLQKKKGLPANSDKKNPFHRIKNYIGKSKRDHTKQATSHNPEKLINPKEAETFYRQLRQSQLPCPHRFNGRKKQSVTISLVEARPTTGRKHQIRVHLSSVGLPLVGDQKYGRRFLKNCNRNYPGHFLQAQSLKFNYQGENYSFQAPEPEWLKLVKR